MTTIALLTANIKLVQVYECATCARKQNGDTLSIFYTEGVDGLEKYIKSLPQIAHNMPVGWSTTLGVGFRCSECTFKRRER